TPATVEFFIVDKLSPQTTGPESTRSRALPIPPQTRSAATLSEEAPNQWGWTDGLAPPSEPTPSKDTMAVPIRILAQVADNEPQPLSEGVITSEQDCDSEIAQALRELADEIENPT